MGVQHVKGDTWVDDYNQVIVNVHKSYQCRNDHCTIHNQSEHHMVGFPQKWRQDRHFMERVCPHGIGHPDPDEIIQNLVHACDRCCIDE
jgi:hypothetical protein